MRFKLGRKRPLATVPQLKLKRYLLHSLAPPPGTVDYSAKAQKTLSDILGNGDVGDCTVAAAFHVQDVLLTNSNAPASSDLSAANAIKLYYHLTGGADSGLDEMLVLNYWQSNGLGPGDKHKIYGYVGVDPTNEIEMKTALYLFENLYFGMQLPADYVAAMETMADGFVWGLAGPPVPANGHAFMGMAYDSRGVTIDTWGILGKFSYDAIAYYCSENQGGQLFSVLSSDAIDRGTRKAPNGCSWLQLRADLQVFS